MSVITNGTKISKYRQVNTAMLFNKHPNSCITWPANTRWKGQKLCATMNLGTKMKGLLG